MLKASLPEKKNTAIARITSLFLCKLIAVGVLVGVLYQYDFLLAVVLSAYACWRIVMHFRNNSPDKGRPEVLLHGMLITGVFGLAAEIWGVSNGYWSYHNLDGERHLPYWLPIAWMCSFSFLYKLELQLIQHIVPRTIRHKFALTVLVATIFPVLGEMIAINFGVWSYHWPMQFMGVPLYAVFCLVIVHLSVKSLLILFCRVKGIDDPLFSV